MKQKQILLLGIIMGLAVARKTRVKIGGAMVNCEEGR